MAMRRQRYFYDIHTRWRTLLQLVTSVWALSITKPFMTCMQIFYEFMRRLYTSIFCDSGIARELFFVHFLLFLINILGIDSVPTILSYRHSFFFCVSMFLFVLYFRKEYKLKDMEICTKFYAQISVISEPIKRTFECNFPKTIDFWKLFFSLFL